MELEDSYQMCTKKEMYEYLIQIAKQPRRYHLTDVVLETLSIIAYKQPVTRLEIEKIRGVKSDHAVNKLIEYDLIAEVGRLDAPGRPILFGTTEEFLRRFSVQSVDELPKIAPEKIEKEEVTVEDKLEYLNTYITSHKKFSFRDLMKKQKSKTHLVVTFLAILEMMKMGKIWVEQEKTFDDIVITSKV